MKQEKEIWDSFVQVVSWVFQGDVGLLHGLLLVILTVSFSWLLSKLLSRYTVRFLGGKRRNSLVVFLPIINRFIIFTFLFIGVLFSFHFVGMSQGMYAGVVHLTKTVFLCVYLNLFFQVERNIFVLIRRTKKLKKIIQHQTIPLVHTVTKLMIIAIFVYILMMIWGIKPTAWLASAGIAGLAITFAAKDSLANIFAGAFIVVDRPYRIGDFIILDGGERGRVTHIGLRSTRLLTRDQVEIIIPNAVIANTKIINESGGPQEKERIRINIGVAYGSDIDKVEQILLDIANNHPDILKDPEPKVFLMNFGDSSVNFELRVWIEEPLLKGRSTSNLNKAIYNRFMSEGVEIPYPKRDVYHHYTDNQRPQ